MLLIIRERVNPALQRHTENALISISFKETAALSPDFEFQTTVSTAFVYL